MTIAPFLHLAAICSSVATSDFLFRPQGMSISDLLKFWNYIFSYGNQRTLPAGFMEIGESTAEGAIRETWKEANADVEVLSPFAHLDIPLIGQTYIIFLAKL
ncbi:unnamed protein product [Fraxinus pennsylvanica]|uniref:Nudix hydrolase domain-containing protein n=1 Tax=Fraxinus pennsylvanica TaxID=56036 RepID=A0AAD1YT14_9LAMI|nr:unnamed protein product [Fraxinus pennsylvanica]